MARKPKLTADPKTDTGEPVADWGPAWFDEQLKRINTNRKRLSLKLKPGSENWLKKLIEGQQHRRIADAVLLADAFRVPINHVISAFGYRCKGPTAAIVGEVLPDCTIRNIPKVEQIEVSAPPDEFGLYNELEALRVDSSLAMPLLFRGALLFCAPNAANATYTGRICVVHGPAMLSPIVGYVAPTGDADVALVTPINPAVAPIRAALITHAAPVLWIKH